jgi:hypothetical protein
VGFTRRYSAFPPISVITQIEGVVTVDQPPPSSVQGVGTGVAALVGEFADNTYATSFDPLTGKFATKAQPVEVFSSQDLIDKVGGFDETIGEFGKSGGNGFVSVRNKRFSRLILVPINLVSQYGLRLWRELPTNQGATAAVPIVPVSGAVIPAGTEFKSGNNRVRLGAKASFAGGQQSQSGVDGDVVAAGAPAAFQTFTSASAKFTRAVVGDVVVLGVIGAAAGQGANAGTYRIKTITSDTSIAVEKLDGTNFDWTTTATSLAWRLHAGAQADTALGTIAAAGDPKFTIPARPLDATIAASTQLSPTVAAAAGTATAWLPTSGLVAAATNNAAGIVYTAGVQAPNAASAAALDALYTSALNSLLADKKPAKEVNLVWTSRKSSTIRTSLLAMLGLKSEYGLGTRGFISPALDQVSLNTVCGDADPGVGAHRNERLVYNWPGFQSFVPEAVGFNIGTADGGVTADGILDDTADGWAVVLSSNLPPENNPGQLADPVPALMAPVLGFQRGALPDLGIQEYIRLKASGIMAGRNDEDAGFIFQSGVTTSLLSGQTTINRRAMADFLEDSGAKAISRFSKLPITDQWKGDILAMLDSFLSDLLSTNNPAAQRITEFSLDDKSGNTSSLEAQGIFVVIGRVRTLATGDYIVFQVQAGPGVNIATA